MKLVDLILQYPAAVNPRHYGLCRLRTFVSSAGTFVLLTDLGSKNSDPSVTNAIERIAATARARGIVVGEVSFIEHYEREPRQASTFDLIHFSAQGNPSWQSLPMSKVAEMLECEASELSNDTLADDRLAEEIDRLRYAANPFIDSPWLESPAVATRRAQIAAEMVSKAQIAALVSAGAKEQNLQRLLKSDLSVFGELYGNPHDEYICFAEFPVANGAVDFAYSPAARGWMSFWLK